MDKTQKIERIEEWLVRQKPLRKSSEATITLNGAYTARELRGIAKLMDRASGLRSWRSGGWTDRTEPRNDLPGEEWKDIPGYEGMYQVSSMGRVYSMERGYRVMGVMDGTLRGRFLKMSVTNESKGGPHVILSKDSRTKSFNVRKLVLKVFGAPAPDGFTVARAIDNDPMNCRLTDLYWAPDSRPGLGS